MARGSLNRKAANVATTHPAELKSAVVVGAAANTDIAVAGIKTTDQLVLVTEHAAGAVPADRTPDTTITGAGVIRSTDDTTGNTLVVLYYSV